MALNKVMIIGNVGADPEVRYLESTDPNDKQRVSRLRVATTERYKDRSGEYKDATEWHTLVCWGKTAEVVEKYIKKGMTIYAEGSLRSRKYTDKAGAEKYTTEIRVDSIQMLGKRADDTAAPAAPAAAPAAKPAPTPAAADDGFPF